MTPMRSIRAKCLDCCCGSALEVRLCPAADCPLYPYRMGHRPRQYQDTHQGANEGKTADSPAFSGKEKAPRVNADQSTTQGTP